jgi:O-antigen ligase/polysaccharide polymerase Wzy-like membrane protein
VAAVPVGLYVLNTGAATKTLRGGRANLGPLLYAGMAQPQLAHETPALGGATTSATSLRTLWLVAPAAAVVVGITCGLAAAQGGYFSTSWGWASTLLLLTLGVWAIWSGRSEVGRPELAFVGLLAAFVCWIGLSTAWSTVPAASVLELERGLVPVACVAAFLVVAHRAHLELLTLALVLSVGGLGLYALTTRLFPDRLGAFDPFAVYRLSEPIGYWNGLGIFAVIGLLSALALGTGASRVAVRAAAGPTAVVLGTTLYFTYSRASWVALGLGLAATVALSPRRLATLVTAGVLGAPAGLAVLAASRSSALTHRESVLPYAVGEGQRLALAVLVLALLAAGLVMGLAVAERRVGPRPRLARALGIAGWASLPVALVIVVVAFGTPADIAQRTWNAFEKPPSESSTDLNQRLFSLSGNGRADLWRVGWEVAGDHPYLGAGAGTFERSWQARTDSSFKVRDAHSLYVETLAELGPVGLGLLVFALIVPFAAAFAARETRVVPALFGAYVAFLVHAGVDWDWELTAVTATGLLAGCLLLLAARTRSSRAFGTPLRTGVVVLAVAGSIAGIVGLLGNSALAHGRSAIDDGDAARAIEQADRARQLMPWSPDPWLVKGEAQLLDGDARGAVQSFRKAIDADPRDWRGWHDLAVASRGRDRARAIRRALALYPTSSEIQRTIAALRRASDG